MENLEVKFILKPSGQASNPSYPTDYDKLVAYANYYGLTVIDGEDGEKYIESLTDKLFQNPSNLYPNGRSSTIYTFELAISDNNNRIDLVYKEIWRASSPSLPAECEWHKVFIATNINGVVTLCSKYHMDYTYGFILENILENKILKALESYKPNTSFIPFFNKHSSESKIAAKDKLVKCLTAISNAKRTGEKTKMGSEELLTGSDKALLEDGTLKTTILNAMFKNSELNRYNNGDNNMDVFNKLFLHLKANIEIINAPVVIKNQ